MRSQILGFLVGWLCAFLVFVGAHHALADAASDSSTLGTLLNDAQIADLCFADAKRGWAVGDRGTIWHTADGGQHWNLQRSGVECQLTSVYFLDAQIGWAAGGVIQPYTHASSGVVLRTRDGGEHWTVERKLILPAITRIGFFDAQHGWALGQPSALFPSGVFASDDGGRAWSALPSPEGHGWLAGDFVDPHNGALAGRTSRLATIRRRGVEPQPADFGLRAMHRMQLAAPAGGWLIGDGGLVLSTRDLGKTWQTAGDEIPPEARDQFDFEALAVRGPHCWIAGTPGTRVWHTADGGQSWSQGDTGQTLPIHALTFVDERNGWAAGDLGTILATTDGGRTWRKQRGGGARAAYVGFFGRPRDIPLELVARLSADEGYLSAIEVLSRDDIDARPIGAADPALQAHEASVLAGASVARSAWRFPLRQAGLKLTAEQLVDDWNRANDTQALERLEAYVAARIRMWRPSVVFTSTADSQAADPLTHVMSQVVLRAIEAAADPSRHADQISQAGLRAWQVQKVFGALEPGESGAAQVDTAQLSARFGRSIGELATPARAVIAHEFVASPDSVTFRLLVDRIPQDVGRRDFFSGITIPPGSEARRALVEVADSDLETLHRQAQRRRNLQAILAKAEKGDPADGRFLADVGEQTRAMQPERAAEVLLQLADRYYRSGRWEMAAECFALVVDRYPNHPLTPAALKWLVQYHASGEAAWRTRTASGIDARQIATQAPLERQQPAEDRKGEGVRRAAAVGGEARVARAAGTAGNLRAADGERFTKADGYSKQLEQLQPALMAEPAVRFPLAVAHRQQGLSRQAERYYLGLRRSRPRDAWWACAQAELWLADPKTEPPKHLWNASPTRAKPHLDGQLDEPMWSSASSVELRSPLDDDTHWPAVAMLSYDDEFLYIGVNCTRAEGFKYTKSDLPRPRDPELEAEDRIELVIDVDRDFVTYYRLTIDHRGWTGEGCWGDKSWNPTWFVASGEAEGAWTAEAAIPLAELSGEPPVAGHAWAVGVQRVVPGVGFQAWTQPASIEIQPEGFGYLIFR